MNTPSLTVRSPQRMIRGLLAGLFGCLALAGFAADAPKKNFDLPAGDAATTLKAFTAQSGEQIVYPVEQVRGMKTNPVKGELATREALNQMLTGTGLSVVQDDKTGALAVRRDPAPNADSRPDDVPAAKLQLTKSGALEMETYSVLGTRIRQAAESEGPSPVQTYNEDDFRSTGALNLADFLRTIPQTYSGVGAGRNSAPDDLNMMSGQRTENQNPLSPNPGSSPFLFAAAPVQTGVSGVSLRGLGSGSTLVLVDGRRVAQAGNGNRSSASGQGFVDLNSIPLGLIERIEITTDGASAIYGADAVAGVINIVTKKSWVGTELSGSVKITEHGGARERSANLTTGFAGLSGRLSGTIGITYYERDPLVASQREFSKNQDFRTRLVGYNATTGAPVYGSDQRIMWGYPASIQSVATTGFVSIPGVRVLLAPEGFATTPPVSAFIPRTTNADNQNPALTSIIAQGQRITNHAPFTELVSGSERWGFVGNGSFRLFPKIEAYGTYSYTDSRSEAKSLPAYVENVLVSAANNPFRENIQFGMMLPQWGQVAQETKTQTHSMTVGLRGQLSPTWRWDSGYRWQDQKYHSVQRQFNQTAFNALANNADPTQRFNPFIDYRAAGAADQAALLAQTVINPTQDGRSGFDSFDASANGDLLNIWGGPIGMSLGGSHEIAKNTFTGVAFAGFPVVPTTTSYTDKRTTSAAFVELLVPLFGKPNQVPLLKRLEVNLAGRYEDISDAGSSQVPKYGLSWEPTRGLLFRGSYSEGYRAPSLTEDRRATLNGTLTLADPARGNQRYLMPFQTRSNPALKPETSTTQFYGVVYEPTFVKGLSLTANYYQTDQRDAILTSTVTTILNNEALFPDLVIRAAPTPEDIALGYKGVVTTLYNQFLNFGQIYNESLDLGADYRLPWEQFGRWRLSVNAAKTLQQTRQLVVGGPVINDVGDTYASPEWNITSSLYWSKGPWNASTTFSYISGFNTNTAAVSANLYPTPAMYLLDVRGTYEFKQGIWRGYGKGVRVGFGIANLLDEQPPFLNNIYGFNAGLHGRWVFGRTYELSLVLPLERKSKKAAP